jgi:hypothetical protein
MQRSLTGTWHNQHGSVLALEISPDGRVSGHFRSGTGLARGEGDFPVTGVASGDLIAFCVSFGKFDSITAWAGHVVSAAGEMRLETQWQMTVALPRRGSSEVWKGIWTGSDVFRRGAPELATIPSKLPSHPLPDFP